MRNITHFLVVIMAGLLLIGCRIQIDKRRYRKGFFIQKSTLLGNGQNETKPATYILNESDTNLTFGSSQPLNIPTETRSTQTFSESGISNENKVALDQNSPTKVNLRERIKWPKKNHLKQISNSIVLLPQSNSNLYSSKQEKEEDSTTLIGLFFALLLFVLVLITFMVFVTALAYGGVNMISITLGIAVIAFFALLMRYIIKLSKANSSKT